jgi:hypothetical protein
VLDDCPDDVFADLWHRSEMVGKGRIV